MNKNNRINYLRLSLTDRCNLNCLYCDPVNKDKFFNKKDILTYEQMIRIIRFFSLLGVDTLRITGGEPLIKKDITTLIKMIKIIRDIKDISLTTNGVELKNYAKDLKCSGLDRINISLNSLEAQTYKTITGEDKLDDVLAGLDTALSEGFTLIKLNVVLLRGVNDKEIIDFVKFAIKKKIIVRFIELYTANPRLASLSQHYIASHKVKEIIENCFGKLSVYSQVKGYGPAEYFSLEKDLAIIGFISNCSKIFCQSCQRIRMDCVGRLYPCLFWPAQADLREYILDNKDQDLLLKIREVLAAKYNINKTFIDKPIVEISSIGG